MLRSSGRVLTWAKSKVILPPCRVFISWPAVAAIAGIMWVLFFALAFYVSTTGVVAFDLAITESLQEFQDQGFFYFMFLISLFGTPPYILGTLLFCAGIALYFKRWLEATFILGSPIAELLDAAAKVLINRPRPTPEEAVVSVTTMLPSFPSGHVVYYVFFYGLMAYLLLPYLREAHWRQWAIAFAVFVSFLVGVSRIYLGAHWFTDVIGGYFFGIGLVLIYIKLYEMAAARFLVQRCEFEQPAEP